jgi:hypothetical protein
MSPWLTSWLARSPLDQDSDAEIVHIRPLLKKKMTHNVGDHGMTGGK